MTNSRFEDLERRAKRIEFKRNVKIFSLIVFLSGIVIGSYIIYQSMSNQEIVIKQEIKQVEKKKTIKQEVVKNIEKKEITIKKEKIKEVKQPLEDKKILKKEVVQEKNEYDTEILHLTVSHKTENKKIDIEERKINNIVEKEDIEEPKSFNIKVKSVNSKEVLLRDYSAKKDFDSAIKLANQYFKEKSYEKSIYWAKEASRIEPSLSEPWIIYAQSKNKLGFKSDAIKALENYLSFFTSRKAFNLLTTLKEVKK